MPVSNGTRFGPYEITGPLGAGGMGEVYRARDSKLNRDVALKVLPAALAHDADYMARFQREAQVLAAVNHPNIAAIYGIEGNAIVMELVEGSHLRGPLPLEEALPIARQIAEALEAAHEKGIIHRDLKPANVKVTPEGVVKVLDFGLAKVAEAVSGGNGANSPTLTMRASEAGMILGTAGYMAPEQAAGKPVDKRADIWAFGVVLWEMLTGKRLFEGETLSHTLAHVLTAPIDFSLLPAATPLAIRELLRRCLERNPKNRMRDIGEARLAIAAPPIAAMVPALKRRSVLPWAAALLAVAIVAGVGWWRATRPEPLRPLIRLDAEMAPDTPLDTSRTGGLLALSPDGTRFAVPLRGADGKVLLYTRLLDRGQFIPLVGTDGASTPFFSPDGEWIGFIADGKLKKISSEGGAAVTLCEAENVRGASWGDDGNIVLALGPAVGLSKVSSAGGTPAPLTKLDPGERTQRWPQVLPGSQAVLFTSERVGSGLSYDTADIDMMLLKTGKRKILVHGGFSGRYLATSAGTGHLVYMRQNTLFAAAFDLSRFELAGPAVPLLTDVSSDTLKGGHFTFSQTGTFVYLAGEKEVTSFPISWLDGSGKAQPLFVAASSFYFTPRFSPDGKRLAFAEGNSQASNIWVKDLDRDTVSRLTFLNGTNSSPVWTPDGKNIIFRSYDPKGPGLYWIHSNGSGEAQRLTDGKLDELPTSISPDGKRLAFFGGANGSHDIFTAAIEGDAAHPKLGKPELFLGTPFNEVNPAFSPDGRWLAYASTESGTFEVYVRPFPGPGGRWQVSAAGGGFPLWSRNGRELFFQTPQRLMMVAGYSAQGDSFNAGKPRIWSETRLRDTGGFTSTVDLAPDGKRLAAILGDDQQKGPTHLTFLLNFSDELQRRAPAGR